MITRVPVDQLKAGMILAEPVMNKNRSKEEGLSAGTKLSEYHLAAIKTWGISSVAIDEEIVGPEIKHEAFQRVKGRMHWVPSHPIEEEIYKVALQRAEDLLSRKEEE